MGTALSSATSTISAQALCLNRAAEYRRLRRLYPSFYAYTPELRYCEEEHCLEIYMLYEIPDLGRFVQCAALDCSFDELLSLCSKGEVLISVLEALSTAEAISYWKLCASPDFYGSSYLASRAWRDFFSLIWQKGLAEYRYRNGLSAENEAFVRFMPYEEDLRSAEKTAVRTLKKEGRLPEDTLPLRSFVDACLGRTAGEGRWRRSAPRKEEGEASDPETEARQKQGVTREENLRVLIPVGGGKDSVVSLELLRPLGAARFSLCMNASRASRACEETAGILAEQRVHFRRRMDSLLLEKNREGYLNGHVPFSAILAHYAYLEALLHEIPYIALSNEASAEASFVEGEEVNHQWSKSLEFERAFRSFCETELGAAAHYFSFLRPLSELAIAALFAEKKNYHRLFRSCNLGSKEGRNLWCCACAKCLFVYILLSAFLDPDETEAIFGENVLEKDELLDDFERLIGKIKVKPFECVGETEEVRYALSLTLKRYAGRPLPALLRHYLEEEKEGTEAENHRGSTEEMHSHGGRAPLGSLDATLLPEPFRSYLEPALDRLRALVKKEETNHE